MIGLDEASKTTKQMMELLNVRREDGEWRRR